LLINNIIILIVLIETINMLICRYNIIERCNGAVKLFVIVCGWANTVSKIYFY
jgi:hypothetical protein